MQATVTVFGRNGAASQVQMAPQQAAAFALFCVRVLRLRAGVTR